MVVIVAVDEIDTVIVAVHVNQNATLIVIRPVSDSCQPRCAPGHLARAAPTGVRKLYQDRPRFWRSLRAFGRSCPR